ncbi:CorA family divalent cation transporter [Sulfurimonas sp. NWX367]|uniref:CorA family divalent cation transporter n=1 Tax=Sulfurimonas sp. NWX367 TaxID=2925413 RepID=UPI003204E7C3
MAQIFLLGGNDLEMIEIKHLLEQSGKCFYDRELTWGAKLSDYKDIFNDTDTFIAIELQEDITPPKNYKTIDHHGKFSQRESSLQQLAKILGLDLNRWQQLVAANDAHYISGLKQLCATPEEIEKIRKADRIAHGVTLEDEAAAKQSLQTLNGQNIIYSHTSHFSTISDRVCNEFTHYVIYNDEKIVFYGYEIKKVIEFLHRNKIDDSNYYFGGGEYGFLGIIEGTLSGKEIQKLIKEFENMQKQKEIISYHTFMLPFTFKGAFQKKESWIYKPYAVENRETYNEYLYFYKHVQEALFNKKGEGDSFSDYYEYKIQEGIYVIDCKKGKYTLEIDGISLRTFQTDVAILTFNLINKEYGNPQDILAINDYGRRIYPPFLNLEKGLQGTKEVLLANALTLQLQGEDPIEENFCRFEEVKDHDAEDLLPSFIKILIKKNFSEQKIKPIIDDRMFLLSQYHNDDIVNKLKVFDEDKNEYAYAKSDFWYEYLFVDGNGKTCQSRHMCQKLITESSYDRWIESGTLFGISRYSFVSLTGKEFGNNILLGHTRTIYFQMFTLLLAYRASIIKFSDEIQNTTDNKNRDLSQSTRKLYKKYLNYLNKLYFKELTAQDQGIELYNQAMQIMEIPKYMHDLDNEMNELHTFVEMIEEKETTKTMNKLTELGTIFLPGTFIAGMLGMNVLPAGISGWLWSGVTFLGIFYVTKKITQRYNINLKTFFTSPKKEHHE